MARGRKKKKHVCAECGEEFNHGIGLRKHQRQTGHKGSEIREEGEEDTPAPPPAAVEPEPVSAEPAPEPTPAPEPAAPRRAAPAPAPDPDPEPVPAASPVPEPEENDQTVAVPRPGASPVPNYAPPPQTPYGYEQPTGQQMPPAGSRMQETKTKLTLVSKGVSRVISAKAKDAGEQAVRMGKDGADIFREALKLAVALICFLAIPTVVFFWWKSHSPDRQPQPQEKVFSIENGALAARSTLLRYLDHLGKGQLNDAYALLTPNWQQDLTYSSFKDAFLDIDDVRWAVSDQQLNGNGDADVLVRLAFREGGKQRRFLGRFRLNKGPQGWRIDRAELSPERT